MDDFLDLVDNPVRMGITPGDPADDALLALMVHVAFSDGNVHPRELSWLERVLPGRGKDQLLVWVQQVCKHELDVEAVSHALPTVDERWKGLRFAARMAWKDGKIQPEEQELLSELATGLELPEGALERVLAEVTGRGNGLVDPERLVEVLRSMSWDAVQLASGPLETGLSRVVPPNMTPIARIGLDNVVVVGLFKEGIAAHFLEGAAWLAWRDLVTFTRVPTLGAAVQVHTEEGRTLTLVDTRLRGVGMLLDRLFSPDARKPAKNPPVIEKIRGGDE